MEPEYPQTVIGIRDVINPRYGLPTKLPLNEHKHFALAVAFKT